MEQSSKETSNQVDQSEIEFAIEASIGALEDANALDLISPDLKVRLAALAKDSRSGVKRTIADKRKELELDEGEVASLLFDMEDRFLASDPRFQDSVDWEEVEKSLRSNRQALFVLYSIAKAGGKPQLTKVIGDEFVFEDSSGKPEFSSWKYSLTVTSYDPD